ncbi:CRISPR system Cascade subunit CasE [Janthinobacterium sp. CG_23.3]|uniref:type I-E CRISPR-associated protein Cas6/Cse3/CasE n=1 Tax=Janthinobacterium sp. CG_23.3 TaxID=3349634 RepID=UPI0038D3A96B
MYFSVITPEDDLLRQAAHEFVLAPTVANKVTPYSEHQWMWRFFPSDEGQCRDFIFRRDDLGDTPRYYVVSKRPPVEFSSAWAVRTRPYAPALVAGQRLAFQLCANPVVSKKNSAGKVQRHDVVMQLKKQLLAEKGLGKWLEWKREDDRPAQYEMVQKTCLDWLRARAATHGYEVVNASVEAYLQHKTVAGEREIRFSTVDYSGELVVTDPERFQQMLMSGLGHAKAFGCGLMLVRNAES